MRVFVAAAGFMMSGAAVAAASGVYDAPTPQERYGACGSSAVRRSGPMPAPTAGAYDVDFAINARSTGVTLPGSARLVTIDRRHYAYVPFARAPQLFARIGATATADARGHLVVRSDEVGRCTVELDVRRPWMVWIKGAKRSLPVPTPLLRDRATGALLVPVRLVAELLGATAAWDPRPVAHVNIAYADVYRLVISPASVTASPGSDAQYRVALKQIAGRNLEIPPDRGRVVIDSGVGSSERTTVHVAPDAKPGRYVVVPTMAANTAAYRKIIGGDRAALIVPSPAPATPPPITVPSPEPGPSQAPPSTCRWSAPLRVSVVDGKKLPFTPSPVPVTGTLPSPLPTPVFSWNPSFAVDPQGRVHHGTTDDMSSIVTISGEPCTSITIQVTLYGDGFVPRRSLAIDYGGATVYDAYSPGNADWKKTLAHAEIEAPLNLRNTWLSVDYRQIGYRHDAASAVPLSCTMPAPANGGAAAGDEGCVTRADGRRVYRTGFAARDTSGDVRFGYRLSPRTVAELAYLRAGANTDRPSIAGFGAGISVPPNLATFLAPYGAVAYYPSISGGSTRYRVLRYRGGATLSLTPMFDLPIFIELSATGDRRIGSGPAPSALYQAVTLGAGYRF